MDRVTKEEFEKTPLLPQDITNPMTGLPESMISEEDFNKLIGDLKNNPLEIQQKLAAKISVFLEDRMSKELRQGGLTADTREWIKEFNKIIEGVNKTVFGDKKLMLHVHSGTVTHQSISQMMRKHRKDIVDAVVVNGNDGD